MCLIVAFMGCGSTDTPSPSNVGGDTQVEKTGSVSTPLLGVTNTHNASFLSRAYISTASFQTYQFGPSVDLLSTLRANGIDTLYVNTANVHTCALAPTGDASNGPCPYADGTHVYSASGVASFLSAILSWETAHSTEPKWKVWALTNGNTGESVAQGTGGIGTGSNTTTIYDSTKNWVGGSLIGLYVRLLPGNAWGYITSNTSTSFTVSAPFTSVPMPGTFAISSWPILRLDLAAVRQKVADESKKFTDPTVWAVGRAFDGVMMDFEPSGLNIPGCPEGNGEARRFDCTKLTLQKVRSVLNPTNANPNTTPNIPMVGATPPRFKNSTDSTDAYRWNHTMYYYGGLYADELAVMAYNMASTYPTMAGITDYVRTSTKEVSAAITGEKWNWDASHPFPARVPNVRIGIGAYATSTFTPPALPMHDRNIENTQTMTLGLGAAITEMSAVGATGHSGLPYVKGAAIFSYNNGVSCSVSTPPPTYCDPVGKEYFGTSYDTWFNWNYFWLSGYPSW